MKVLTEHHVIAKHRSAEILSLVKFLHDADIIAVKLLIGPLEKHNFVSGISQRKLFSRQLLKDLSKTHIWVT